MNLIKKYIWAASCEKVHFVICSQHIASDQSAHLGSLIKSYTIN